MSAAESFSLATDPKLELAAVYRRVVRAGVGRIWENVFDWEHLPVLHETYFNAVELLAIDTDGWRVRLSRQPGDADRMQILQLSTDRVKRRYSVRTLAGAGTGTEIWTRLTPLRQDQTAIEVRYYLPEKRPDRIAELGAKYRSSCARLWDEDERMMMRREAMAKVSRAPLPAVPVRLGPLADLRARLPLLVDFAGQPFRVLELDGELLAHSTICPHWLGPLDEVEPEGGCIRCPWHGWSFDIRTGRSADGRNLRLQPAPRVAIDPQTGTVSLLPR